MKTKVFNLIILDESGSMGHVRKATISGCNETLNTIRSMQKENIETQEHYVSIYVFQENTQVPSRYLVKNEPIDRVKNVKTDDYEPWGSTPLYDAIGSTLADLKSVTKVLDTPIANVTIITDGLENASRRYTLEQVTRMIDALKEVGWNFNFIGANIDVQATAQSFHINNSLEFRQDEAGMQEMFQRERAARSRWARKMNTVMENRGPLTTEEDRMAFFSVMADCSMDYFDEESEEKSDEKAKK